MVRPFLTLVVLSVSVLTLRADNVTVTKFMVPMRDGVRLATDVYLPTTADLKAKAAGLPCLLIRTHYGRTRYDREFGSMSRWSYAVAIQDTRGRFDSEGKPMGFQDDAWGERQDGRDTVDWLARQPVARGTPAPSAGEEARSHDVPA